MTKQADEEVCFIVPSSISAVDQSELLKACRIANFSKTANGLFFWIKDDMVPSPTTLFPSAVPRENFYELKRLQLAFNRLYHKISLNTKFIKDCLESAKQGDEFCASLLDIMDKREKKIDLHKAQFGIFRADYMFEKQENGSADGNSSHNYISRQIEVNTIACSFAGLSEATADLHKNVANFFGETYLDGGDGGLNGISNTKVIRMPKMNNCLFTLSSAFTEAFSFYCNKVSPKLYETDVISHESTPTPLGTANNMQKCIIFVVDANESNIVDQLKLQQSITSRSGILVCRKTFQQLREEGRVDNLNRFILGNNLEVAIFYFRTGYVPSAYKSSLDWKLREDIDCSIALSCPSVSHQLAGMKKFQQILAQPGALEQFENDPDLCHRMRQTFCGFKNLDFGSEGDEAIAAAIENPAKYVLKPQLEGGGHNYFEDEMTKKLESIRNTEERQAYVLMERVYPTPVENLISCCNYNSDDTNVTVSNVIVELGVYGTVLSDLNGDLVLNQEAGHLLRSKHLSKLDGGVVAGNACLDSPHLVWVTEHLHKRSFSMCDT